METNGEMNGSSNKKDKPSKEAAKGPGADIKSELQMDDDEPEYAVVAESLDECAERIELPVNDADRTLGLQTLIHAFPGAHGLKFRNPATRALRALLMDSAGTKFLAPSGGWAGKVFVVIYQHQSLMGKKSVDQQQHTAPPPSEPPAPPPPPASASLSTSTSGGGKRRKLMAQRADASGSGTKAGGDDSQAGQNSSGDDGPEGVPETGANKKRLVSSSSSNLVAAIAKSSLKCQLSQEDDYEEYHHHHHIDDERDANDDEQQGFDNTTAILDEVTDLIVLGLPWALTTDELRAHFEKIKTSNGTSKGFGFIQMSNVEEQSRVLAHAKGIHTINGRRCTVRVPFTKGVKDSTPLSNKAFVGRITEQTTHEELKTFFTEEAKKFDESATVTEVYIPRPFRAFAFLTFSTPVVAQEIIKKKNFELNGIELSASTANPRFAQQSVYSSMQQQHLSPMKAEILGAPYNFTPQQTQQQQISKSRGARGRPAPAYFEGAYEQQHKQRRDRLYESAVAPPTGGPYVDVDQQTAFAGIGGMFDSGTIPLPNNMGGYGYGFGAPSLGGAGPLPPATNVGARSPHPASIPPMQNYFVAGQQQQLTQQQLPTAQLETLNLNNMNSEVMTAALKAFFTAAANAAQCAHQQQQQPPPPVAASLMSSPHTDSPPPGYHHQQQSQQSRHQQQQGAGRNMRRGGNSPAHYANTSGGGGAIRFNGSGGGAVGGSNSGPNASTWR